MSQHICTQYGIAPAQNIFLSEWFSANMLYISAVQYKEEFRWNMLVRNVNHSSIKSYLYVEGLLEPEMNCKECCSAKPNSLFWLFLQSLEDQCFSTILCWFKNKQLEGLLCYGIRIRNLFCSTSVKFYSNHHSYRWKDNKWYLHCNMSFLKITDSNCDTTLSKWNQQTFRVSDETWRNKTLKILHYVLHSLILLFS